MFFFFVFVFFEIFPSYQVEVNSDGYFPSREAAS